MKKITPALLARYLLAGASGAGTQAMVLYLLSRYLGLWYLMASVVAFCCAIAVSFILQKFWTFRNPDRDRMRAQFALYAATVLLNLCLNTFLMYLFVETMKLQPVLAQLVTSAIVAIPSFFIYRHIVFKKKRDRTETALSSVETPRTP